MEKTEESHVIFISETMKSIIGGDRISSNEGLEKISISNEDLKSLQENDEYDKFVEDLKGLNDVLKVNDLKEIEIRDIDIADKPELSEDLARLIRKSEAVSLQNSNLGNLEDFFRLGFEREDITDETLKNSEYIKKLQLNKFTQEATISAEDTAIFGGINKYFQSKKLVVELGKEEDKENIFNNIDALREYRQGIIDLKDVSPEGNIQDMSKIQNYVDGTIILFRSKILKDTMGFDRLPTGKDTGTLYNIKIDGSKLIQDGKYKLEGKELEAFLSDMQELSGHVALGGINIRNIEFPEDADLGRLSNAMGEVNRLNIENSSIPNLKDMINNLENKDNLDTVFIKNAGIELEDIDVTTFPEMRTLSIKNISNEMLKEKSTQRISQENINKDYMVQVEKPWYKKIWDKVKETKLFKSVFSGNSVKALPAAPHDAEKEVQQNRKAGERREKPNEMRREADFSKNGEELGENDSREKREDIPGNGTNVFVNGLRVNIDNSRHAINGNVGEARTTITNITINNPIDKKEEEQER